jgi:hypothetical protein
MKVIPVTKSRITITGKVVDENGQAMAGVHVYDSTNQLIGTTTDLNGKYSLNIGYLQPVKLSYMGYQSIVHRANKIPEIIRLLPEENALPEVVLNAPEKTGFFKKTALKIGIAAVLLGAMVFGLKEEDKVGLNGYTKVKL